MRTITLKMKTAAEIQAIIDALPPVNNLDLSTNKPSQALQRLNVLLQGGRIYLQDLGIREIGYARRRAVVGQALYMEPWDGVSDIIDISAFLLGVAGAANGHSPVADPIKGLNLFLRDQASDANFGRIRLIETDEINTSIERGMIGEMLAAGIMEIEEEPHESQRGEFLIAAGAARPVTITHNFGVRPLVQVIADAAGDGPIIPADGVALDVDHVDENSFTVDTLAGDLFVIALA